MSAQGKLALAPWNIPESLREQFRDLKALLRCRCGDRLCVAVCSHESGEGVSWVVSKLACALAEEPAGSVLIVEGEGAHATQAKLFGVSSNPAEEVLREGATTFLSRRSSSPQLFVVTVKPLGSPSQTAQDEELCLAIPRLRGFAKTLIVDCEPMSSTAQLMHIGKVTDGVLFVVEAERERREAIARSLEALKRAGIPVCGVVLNKRRRHIPDFVYELL